MTTKNQPVTEPRYSTGDRLITMTASHDAFRRDLRQMAVTATPGNLRNPKRQESIHNGWGIFKNQLNIHHHHEDTFLWPRLRHQTAANDSAQSMLDEMEYEHGLIDPLFASIDAAFARPEDGDVRNTTEELISTLSRHLEHEEREAMPLIEEVISDEEWASVVRDIRRATKLSTASEFMPWLMDGTSKDETKAILSIVPPPARLVINKVWRPRYQKVNHW